MKDHENESLQWWNIIWAAFIKVREWDNYFYLAIAIGTGGCRWVGCCPALLYSNSSISSRSLSRHGHGGSDGGSCRCSLLAEIMHEVEDIA